MLTGLLFALTLAPGTATGLVPPGTTQDPAVKVWLNKGDRVDRGDRVKAYVRTDDDGYLLVLHVEPDGRIRFLYPIDPYVDNFVRGHDKVEIRGRGGREAFRVYQEDGLGTVFAASRHMEADLGRDLPSRQYRRLKSAAGLGPTTSS